MEMIIESSNDQIMKQQLIHFESTSDLSNIPEYLFRGATIIITYITFTKELYKYIYVNNLFLIPDDEFEKIIKEKYEISNNVIKYSSVLKNDGTIDNINYLPYDENRYNLYIKNFNNIKININSLKDCLLFKDVKIDHNNTDNVDARLLRFKQYSDKKLGNELEDFFYKNFDKFLSVSSAALITNDFDNATIDIKIKLNEDIYVYDYYGFSSYLDTFTKYYFYHERSIRNDILFNKEFLANPEVVCFYSILNYILTQNIHKHSNIYEDVYLKMLSYFKGIINGTANQKIENNTR